VTVLDVAPPELRRRGSAAARAAELSELDGRPDAAGELRRRRLVRAPELVRMGVPADGVTAVAGDWLADPEHWAALRTRLVSEVDRYAAAHPVDPDVPVDAVRQRLGLPDRALVEALVTPPLIVRDGRIGSGRALPERLRKAVDAVHADLRREPFAAPDARRLAELGLGPKEIGAAVKARLLLRIADGVVLLPDVADAAVRTLHALPQPFTLSEARQALRTTRRVAVPLLEFLGRRGATRQLADGRHTTDS
ncbi:SelB C-terminal domain-containing protein, partial [Dactylosporangium fulvum]